MVNATKDSSDVTVKSNVCRHTNVIFCPCYCTDNDGVKVSSMNFPQIMSKINPLIFVLDIIASNLEGSQPKLCATGSNISAFCFLSI